MTNGSFSGTIDLPFDVSTDYSFINVSTEVYGFAGYGGNVIFDPTIKIILPQGAALVGSYAYLVPVPEPSALACFASGLCVIGLFTWRRRIRGWMGSRVDGVGLD